jgi:hypothetical protein
MRLHTESQTSSLRLGAIRIGIVLVVCGSFWYGIAELAARLAA